MPCSVVCHQFAHVLVELLLMIFGVHVNVIDNDYTSNIPQAQLVNNLLCSQHVVVEGVLLLVGIHFLRAAVDIDREQCLGLVDDQVSAILETYCATETGLQLACDIVLVEYRLVAGIEFDDLGAFGRYEFDIFPYFIVHALIVDLNGIELGREQVADDSCGSSDLLTNEAYGLLGLQQSQCIFPFPHEDIEFGVQIFELCTFSHCTDNHSVSLRPHLLHQFAQSVTLAVPADFVANHHLVAHRHKYHVAPGERDLGSQTRTFGIDGFLGDLY